MVILGGSDVIVNLPWEGSGPSCVCTLQVCCFPPQHCIPPILGEAAFVRPQRVLFHPAGAYLNLMTSSDCLEVSWQRGPLPTWSCKSSPKDKK